VRPSANNGFGANTITTHHHNGHNPAESDGFGAAYFFPGQFYDYVWPMVLAGNDSMNTDASSDWSGRPDDDRGITRVRGDWHETMSTHWFHDHMVDYTAQNVYKGNAAMMNLYSSIDTGVEDYECNYENDAHPNMCFPSGTALGWGNRDYDVNLVIGDKAWDRNGQLFFNIFNLDGFVGDRMTVNWQYKPYTEVRARRYRFRLLNGSVSRYLKIAVINAGTGQRIPFHMIANDGNIMEHTVRFPNAQSQDLPTQAIGERYDIIIDFTNFAPGTRIQFVNLLEHKDGKGPNDYIPLNDVLRGRYDGDPAVGPFLEFRVVPYSGVDYSMDPTLYEEGGREMIPVSHFREATLTNARQRVFEFGRSGGSDEQPWTIKVDGGNGLAADLHRVSTVVRPGAWEIWTFRNGGNGWAHPIHAHFEEGYILSRDGRPPPIWERGARKDVFRIGPEVDSSREVRMLVRFREFLGTYMEHCHNTQHEDHAMLLRFDARDTGQMIAIPTPVPTWEGVYYEPSFDLRPGS
jgi:manganese oxidase